MKEVIKTRIEELSAGERLYASTVIPLFISFTVYMLVGIPLLMP